MLKFSAILLVSLLIAICGLSVEAADCPATNGVLANTGGTNTGTTICSDASNSAAGNVLDGATCFLACPVGTRDTTSGIVDISVNCPSGGTGALNPDPACAVNVCDTASGDATALGIAGVTPANTATACAGITSRSAYLNVNSACASTVTLANNYYDFTTLASPTATTAPVCTASNTFGFNANVAPGCDTAPSTVAGVSNLAGTSTCPTAAGALKVGDTTQCTVDLSLNYYDFQPSTPVTTVALTCTASPNTYSPVNTPDISQGCLVPSISNGGFTATQVDYSTSSCTKTVKNTGSASCTVNTRPANHYYKFASGTSSTSVSLTCGTGGTYTTADTVALGCDAAPTGSISGVSTGLNLGSSGSGECGAASNTAAVQQTTGSCNVPTSTGYYNFATPTAPTISISATCSSAPSTYTSTDAANVAFGCDGPAPNAGAVSGPGSANVDIASSTVSAGTACASLGASTAIKTGLTTSTCNFPLNAHYYDFANSKRTYVTAYCSGSTSIAYTLSSSQTIDAGCDAAVTSLTGYTDGTDVSFSSTTGTNRCASLTTTSPIQANGASCTIATVTNKYQFASGVGSNEITATCTGPNTYSPPAAAKNIAYGCGVWTVGSVSNLASTKILSTTSSGCASVTGSNALANGAGCTIELAAGYRDFTNAASPATSTAATCAASVSTPETFTVTTPANVQEVCYTAPSAVGGLLNLDTAYSAPGYCSAITSTNVLAVGSTCKVALATGYYDYTASSTTVPAVNYITATCASGNTFTTTAAQPNIIQSCDSSATITTSGAFETDVTIGGFSNCGGPVQNGLTCVATCGNGKVVDPALGAAGTVPVYQCTASTNTLALQTPVSVTSNICLPAGCQVPPALADSYDFTAGTNPCSAVTTTNRILGGATCTLKCVGGTFPKGNVPPTFTCNPTTNVLEPTTYDVCVAGSNLPVTMLVFGTKST